MSLGKRLKQARESLGYSQKEMAEKINSYPQTWRVYESDKSVPGGNVLEALSRLGFSVDWLLTGEGEMKRDSSGGWWSEKIKEIRGSTTIPEFVQSIWPFSDSDKLIATVQAVEDGKMEANFMLINAIANERRISIDWMFGFKDVPMFRTSISSPEIFELDSELLTLLYEVIEDIDSNPSVLSAQQKAELFCFVYQMHHGNKKYTKDRLKRFIEAVCVFIEQGIDFNKLSERKLSNIIIQIAHHVVKGEGEE